MVFDYAEHDLTGMMDAVKTRGQLTPPQVSRWHAVFNNTTGKR
jgi:hypothetical protein